MGMVANPGATDAAPTSLVTTLASLGAPSWCQHVPGSVGLPVCQGASASLGASEAAPSSMVTSLVSSSVPPWCQYVPKSIGLADCERTKSMPTPPRTSVSQGAVSGNQMG